MQATIGGEMQTDHPLQLGTLQHPLRQQHQAQSQTAKRGGQQTMG
jgi:hypothetical protein